MGAAYMWLVLDPLTGESRIGLDNGDGIIRDKIIKQMAGGRFQHMVAVKTTGSDTFELMSRTEAKKHKGSEVKEIAQPKRAAGVFYY